MQVQRINSNYITKQIQRNNSNPKINFGMKLVVPNPEEFTINGQPYIFKQGKKIIKNWVGGLTKFSEGLYPKELELKMTKHLVGGSNEINFADSAEDLSVTIAWEDKEIPIGDLKEILEIISEQLKLHDAKAERYRKALFSTTYNSRYPGH